MKKFLKLTTIVVSMIMALAFVSCANGNSANDEDGQLNLVGTYGISKVEELHKNSHQDVAITMTMPTSTSLHEAGTFNIISDGSTISQEYDLTVTKTTDGYSFSWVTYNINGEAQGAEAKSALEATFDDETWTRMTAMFAMTITTTAEGTWTDNGNPASSGTYIVDEANSKVTVTMLVEEGTTLTEPEEMDCAYSNDGKNFVVVEDRSFEGDINKSTITFTRQ